MKETHHCWEIPILFNSMAAGIFRYNEGISSALHNLICYLEDAFTFAAQLFEIDCHNSSVFVIFALISCLLKTLVHSFTIFRQLKIFVDSKTSESLTNSAESPFQECYKYRRTPMLSAPSKLTTWRSHYKGNGFQGFKNTHYSVVTDIDES